MSEAECSPTSAIAIELTIQDYFAHFPDFHKNIYRPHLLTPHERAFLARSISRCPEPPRDPTQHPAFTKLDLVGKAWIEFESLSNIQSWPRSFPHNEKYLRNRMTFSRALASTCRKLIKWAEEDLKLEAERHLANDLEHFFTGFECPAYRYYRHNSPFEEFERLGEIKNWAEGRQRSLRKELEDMLDQHKSISSTGQWAQVPATPVDKTTLLYNFFSRFAHQIEAYTYDPAAYPPREFNRLVNISAWFPQEIARNKRQFNLIYGTTDAWTFYGMTEFSGPNPVARPITVASRNNKSRTTVTSSTTAKRSSSAQTRDPRSIEVDLSKSPIAMFCSDFNGPGYRYTAQTSIEEFEQLSNVMEERLDYFKVAKHWASTVIPESEVNVLNFWKSQVYRELQHQFYRAVEKQFDWFVDIQCYRTGLKRHQYLVLFFEVGDGKDGTGGTITRGKAEQLLSKIHINIYDFLDHQDQILQFQGKLIVPTSEKDSSGSNMDSLASSLKVVDIGSTGYYPNRQVTTPTVPTKFPTVQLLGIYCEVTHRIFNMGAASSNGILIRLLKPVGSHFGPKARGKYLTELAAASKGTSALTDIDVMMLTKMAEFYRGMVRHVPGEVQGNPRRPQRIPEDSHNLQRYQGLFNRAQEQQRRVG